jgi:uncharacterized protein YbjT (DUF2867 family)
MKVLVIGANGATGKLVTADLIDRGHTVSAFVRRPGAMGDLSHNVNEVVGDVMDPTALDRAVPGHDAVVVTLGIRENPFLVRFRGASGTASEVRSRGTRNVIEAMARHGVDRLVVQSTHGVGTTFDDLSWSFKLFFRLILQPQIEDSERQESMVRRSDAEWVLVRPVGLTDDEAGDILASPDGKIRSMNVPRRSVAGVLVDAMERPDWIGKAVSVSA